MIKNVYKSLFRFSYGTWIQALISILSLPIFARFLNPSEYAVISLFILIYTILISIIFLGIDQSFVRFYYDYSDKIKYINSYLIISLISYTIFSFLVFYYKNIISIYIIDSDSYFLIGLLLLHLFSGIILRYLTLVLRCEDLSILYSNSQIFLSISYFILGVICILIFKNVYSLIIGAVISQCLVAIYLYAKLNKIIVFNFSNNLIDRSFIKEITKYSLPFIPIIFLDWLFLNFDKTILREYTDLNSLGIYFTAYKIVFVLNIIQIGFKSFWFPYALNKYKDDPDAFLCAQYNAHIQSVQDMVPRDRLLVFNVTSGWAPLCEFLKKDIPQVPFPFVNESDDIQMATKLMKIITYSWIPILATGCYVSYRLVF